MRMLMILLLVFFPAISVAAVVDLGDLTISDSRVPDWTPGVTGGIPDTSGWNVIEANDAQYNVVCDGVTVMGPALQVALDAAAIAGVPTVVHLNAGNCIVGCGNHLVLDSNVVLEGEGPGKTNLTYWVKKGGAYAKRHTVILGSDYARANYPSAAIPTDLASNAAIGDTSVTTTSAHGLSVNDWVIIAETGKDPSLFQNYNIGANADSEWVSHIAKVTAINSLQVTFDRPLRIAIRTAWDSQIRKLEMAENAGLQNLSLIGHPSNETQGPIAFNYAVNSWVYNVELTQPYNRFITLEHAARNTVERVTFTGPSIKVESTSNYGVNVTEGAHDNLITNNTFELLYTVLLFHEGASGNVTSYNYVKSSRFLALTWEWDMECHGTYTHENLFEGNDLLNGGRHDNYWGSNGPRNTWYRNRMFYGYGNNLKDGARGWYFEAQRPDSPEDMTTLILNFVNVITASYRWSNPPGWWVDSLEDKWGGGIGEDNTNMWFERNGVTDDSGVTGINVEPIASTTTTGNFLGDVAPGSWATDDLPESLYLSAAPSFWGGKAWPAIGADVDEYGGSNVKLPAQDRLEGSVTVFNMGTILLLLRSPEK